MDNFFSILLYRKFRVWRLCNIKTCRIETTLTILPIHAFLWNKNKISKQKNILTVMIIKIIYNSQYVFNFVLKKLIQTHEQPCHIRSCLKTHNVRWYDLNVAELSYSLRPQDHLKCVLPQIKITAFMNSFLTSTIKLWYELSLQMKKNTNCVFIL